MAITEPLLKPIKIIGIKNPTGSIHGDQLEPKRLMLLCSKMCSLPLESLCMKPWWHHLIAESYLAMHNMCNWQPEWWHPLIVKVTQCVVHWPSELGTLVAAIAIAMDNMCKWPVASIDCFQVKVTQHRVDHWIQILWH